MAPKLPTYQNAAAMLEHRNGSGWRLAGWTMARSLLILPGMLAVGVKPKKAIAGALIASGLISLLVVCVVKKNGDPT